MRHSLRRAEFSSKATRAIFLLHLERKGHTWCQMYQPLKASSAVGLATARSCRKGRAVKIEGMCYMVARSQIWIRDHLYVKHFFPLSSGEATNHLDSGHVGPRSGVSLFGLMDHETTWGCKKHSHAACSDKSKPKMLPWKHPQKKLRERYCVEILCPKNRNVTLPVCLNNTTAQGRCNFRGAATD